MAAVDTNVLVRLLTGDDPVQLKAAETLFAREDIFIPHTVLLETEWVLRAAFELDRDDVCSGFRALLGLPNVSIPEPALVAQVIDWHEAGLDFADAFHLAASRAQSTLKTFDRNFVKRAKRLSDVVVSAP